MLVFWKARLVLLAVPKTGTTALEAALLPHADTAILGPPGQKHCSLRRYRRHLQPFFTPQAGPPLETMAVIREPVAWLSSWYRYRSRDRIRGTENSTAGIDFDTFVAAWLQDSPPAFARVGRQSRFVSDEDGTPGVDHLFRHDRMEGAIAFLQDRLNFPVAPDRRNVSPPGDVSLSPGLGARLRSEAAAEFDLWESI